LHKPSNQAPVLLQLAQAAKLIEGWTDTTAASVVNIALLGSDAQPKQLSSDTIEAELVPKQDLPPDADTDPGDCGL